MGLRERNGERERSVNKRLALRGYTCILTALIATRREIRRYTVRIATRLVPDARLAINEKVVIRRAGKRIRRPYRNGDC